MARAYDPGSRYQTEMTVEVVDDSGVADPESARTVRAEFFGEASTRDDGILPEMRRVDASLEEGRYRLTVAVTDRETGRIARRSRLFQIREWGRGATLVPALPAKRQSPPIVRRIGEG